MAVGYFCVSVLCFACALPLWLLLLPWSAGAGSHPWALQAGQRSYQSSLLCSVCSTRDVPAPTHTPQPMVLHTSKRR